MSSSTKYICIEDLQNTNFHVGDAMTAQEWKEWAMSMNDFDEFDEEYQEKFANYSPEEAVDAIASIWDLVIVPFDETDPEHQTLYKEYNTPIVIKRDDYKNPCEMIITKSATQDNTYTLVYPSENYEYTCSKEELLTEISEHLDNIKVK